ncbi:caspase-1-like isoform X2 [Sciurus carolinensis]|uniref:caspase-1-like isoform X2 n=1 Tax=Sciurus carolinensis TaxID=30640 RepID=UPI001FB4752B|nr:caspase-1-like isoform X2 [Sciurus carolinensis]
MADKRLKEERRTFISSVSEDTLHNLLDDVLTEEVLNQEEVERVKKKNATTKDKARDLIDLVIPKGSCASQKLIDYICKRDSTLAYKLGFSSETIDGRPESVSEEFKGLLKLCPHQKFLEQCKKEAGRIYPIREKGDRTRLALIICNTEFESLPRRNGSEHDIQGMERLLEDLGYTVVVERNLTAQAMKIVLRDFAARPEHEYSDSTFLVLMSHGIFEGICGIMHGGETQDVLPYDPIFQIFNNHNCSHLKDKPKVIIIQACRGGNTGEVWISDSPAGSVDSSSRFSENLMHDGVHKAHVEKDFVAFCSSTPHNLSWRKKNGSIFITELVNNIQKHSWYCHLTEIFMMVQRSFEIPGMQRWFNIHNSVNAI